jgi:hypothetical protein
MAESKSERFPSKINAHSEKLECNEWPSRSATVADGWTRTPTEKRDRGRQFKQRPESGIGKFGRSLIAFARARDLARSRQVIVSTNYPTDRYGIPTESKRQGHTADRSPWHAAASTMPPPTRSRDRFRGDRVYESAPNDLPRHF